MSLHALQTSKLWPAIGALFLSAAGTLQAVNLDPWAHARYPYLGVLAIVCTGLGGALTTIGKSLTATDQRRATDPVNTNTAEMRAQAPDA